MPNPIGGLSTRQGNRLINKQLEKDLAEDSGDHSSRPSGINDPGAGPSRAISPFAAFARDDFFLEADAIYPDYTDAVYDSDDEGVSTDDHHLRVVDEDDLIGLHADEEDIDEEENEVEKDPPHLVELRRWAMICNTPKRHLSMLLKVLNKSHGGYPLDSRTLLRTPRKPTIPIIMLPGKYFHYGLLKALLSYPFAVLIKLGLLLIDFSTDGFAFANSSKRCGWPIFVSIVGSNLSPVLIGLYIGESKKPDNIDDFMRYLVEELRELDGKIEVPSGPNEVVILEFKIRCFIADSPGRCFVVSSRYHNHKYGCHRCNQATVNRNLQNCKGEPRTDESFYNRTHPDHHSDKHKTLHSLLEIFGFKMISQFPLDVMHMMDLGIGKLILTALIEKKMHFGPKTDSVIEAIKILYATYESFCPSEFARKPRNLEQVHKFKATEFRQFLLYTGVVFMNKLLSPAAYQHFLCASLGYRIVCSSDYDQFNGLQTADKLFAEFVKHFKRFYKRNLSYNVHSMLHLVECVRDHGKADSFSSYKYENSIRKLQFYIHNNTNIFSQINNRLAERETAGLLEEAKEQSPFIVSAKKNDCCFRLANKEYVIVTKVLPCKKRCTVRQYRSKTVFFEKPLVSYSVGIVQVDDAGLSAETTINLNALKRKCYRVPYDDKFVLIPFIV